MLTENPSGMPRPVAPDLMGKLRPVPWTQVTNEDGTHWGKLDTGRSHHCENSSLCLACGEYVEDGWVIWDTGGRVLGNPQGAIHYPVIDAYKHGVEFHDLGNARIVDSGPLHDRCALITRSHCKVIRNGLHEGYMHLLPYTGPVAYGLS